MIVKCSKRLPSVLPCEGSNTFVVWADEVCLFFRPISPALPAARRAPVTVCARMADNVEKAHVEHTSNVLPFVEQLRHEAIKFPTTASRGSEVSAVWNRDTRTNGWRADGGSRTRNWFSSRRQHDSFYFSDDKLQRIAEIRRQRSIQPRNAWRCSGLDEEKHFVNLYWSKRNKR